MAQSVITSAFEHLKAQESAGGNRIIIDQFVFANIPGLNVTDTPPESEPLPPDAQIVHRQAVDRNGVVNENTVAYSVTLPESVGDFTFNWLGLVSSATNTLCMAVYLHSQEKIKTEDGKQGNTLIYSEIMEYAGASAATGITTPVSTWQIDFTARLHGMDEATRKAALDIYGPGLFFDNAFKLTAQATGQATFAPGIAYLRGLRVELGVSGTLTYSTGISQTVYVDAALTGTPTGENKATFSLTSQKSADYIDSLGFAHYVEPIATISDSGEITDIRKTRKPLNDRLDGEFLARDGNLKEIADKGEQAQSDTRGNIGLGNSATRNVGTTINTVAAGDDARILATKKAIDDTQTGLAAQGVMWISTADDLSNLPAGARRFAKNNAGVTVLPAASYFFLEVLAKRSSASGSCILATSNTGNVWIGLRYTVPADANFTWIQLNQNVENLGLTEAVKRALNAVQKTGDTMAGPLINTHPDAFRLKQPGRSFFWRFDDVNLYLLRTAINDPDGSWDAARPFYVNADSGQVYLGPDTKINGDLYVGDARVHTNGNINSIAWGGWLSDYLNIQFAGRDNNINVRATIDWVSQNFVNDITLGVEVYHSPGSNTVSWIFHAPAGHVLTGINISDTGSNSADNINGVYYKPIQKRVNGVLMTIAG